jgi:hypothetical protein
MISNLIFTIEASAGIIAAIRPPKSLLRKVWIFVALIGAVLRVVIVHGISSLPVVLPPPPPPFSPLPVA